MNRDVLNQASNMEFFGKTVKRWKLLIIFAKSAILDIWLSSEFRNKIATKLCLL